MSDQHDFDAWHVGGDATRGSAGDVYDGGFQGDEVPEVDAREHDLWGFGAESVPSRRGAARREEAGYRDETAGRNRSGRPSWLAPVLVIALAIAAFGAAWMMTRGSRDTPPVTSEPSIATSSSTRSTSSPSDSTSSSGSSTATSSSTSDSPSSTSSSTASSTSSAASSSASASSSAASSSSATSSSSSSPAATASAPADAVSTCGDGQPIGDGGVKLAAGSASSCAYVATAAGQVRDRVAHDAGATSFSISPYSEALHRVVPLTCTRADHLTECTGGRGVRFWVAG